MNFLLFTMHHTDWMDVKYRLVLPFWCRLTWVVLDKGLLNGCVCVWYYAPYSIVNNMPSVLWHCWLGSRKGIRHVKTEWWGVAWLSVWSKVQTCIWPSWCHCHSLCLASVKSRLVLPFRYRLTWAVPEKGPLNGCVCVCYYAVATSLFRWKT